MDRTSIVILAALCLVGCASGTSTVPNAAATPAASSQPLRITGWSPPHCPVIDPAIHEIQGTATPQHEIWELILGPFPLRAAVVEEVIIRMTGVGDALIYADGPQGQQIAPSAGPEAHAGSSWNRPGQEWGMQFVFKSPGCWNIRVVLRGGLGTVPIAIPS